jgi:MYXO-CTERM domain-containing protein
MRCPLRLWPTLALVALFSGCAAPPPEGEFAIGQRSQAVKQGDLVISEIYASPPAGVTDGEWFELYNTTDQPIDLKAWSFKDNKNEEVVSSSVTVPAHGYVVLGQSDKSKTNGGVSVDYAYGNKLGLSSKGDELHLVSPGGNEIDAVVFDGQSPWPTPADGVSLQLDPLALDATANDAGASWCLAQLGFPDKKASTLGTPGGPNSSCGGGQGGSGQGGSGQGGSGTAGSGQAGQGQAGSGTAGQGQAGSGQAGSGQAGNGQGGGTCKVSFHKLEINEPDAATGPKDTAEAVELQVQGGFTPGKTTLADCGVDRLSPYDASADATGVCGPKAGTYNETSIGDLVIPASGYVLIGNIPQADRPLLDDKGMASSVLKNGPDYLTLRASDGSVLAAVSYPDNDAPDVYAACDPSPGVEKTPADDNKATENRVLVRCPDDSWALLSEAKITWKADNTCPAKGSGGQGGDGQGGSGAAGSGPAGAAGKGQVGGAAGSGPGGSGPGGSGTAGGAAGGGDAGAPGDVLGGGDTSDGSSCQYGAGGSPRGWWPALLALGAAARRRINRVSRSGGSRGRS